jgi:alpha-ketoglutarate-dependent taurine dioxygenase
MMNISNYPQSSRKSLATVKRQAVKDLVQIAPLMTDSALPLLIRATVTGVNLVDWAKNNQELITNYLSKYGGILFRNFQIQAVTEFEQFIRVVAGELLEYSDRSSPRSPIQGKVYTSTDHPADQKILLHSENSYAATYPLKIFFHCVTPAQQGGETPIADTRKIYQAISPQIQEKFIRKQVMYVRNFGDGFGLPWQTVFQTTNPAEVEEFCHRNEIEFAWKVGNKLRTYSRRPAVVKHPHTGEVVWFNHALFFHVSSLKANIRKALLTEFKQEDLPHNTYYGDASEIEPQVLDELREIYDKQTVTFSWMQGDVLMLDNMLTAHGRESFVGDRKVVVGMGEVYDRKQYSEVK